MKKQDEVFAFSNPRLLSAIYFGLLSVVGTMLINALLSILNIDNGAPLFKAVLWGMFVASCTGAIFGRHIIYCKKPYQIKTFLIGFFMVLISLPVFDFGILLLMQQTKDSLYSISNWHEFVHVFMLIFGYSYVLFGFVLAIGSGLAAMYLRGRLVYDILHTDDDPKLQQIVEIKPKSRKLKVSK